MVKWETIFLEIFSELTLIVHKTFVKFDSSEKMNLFWKNKKSHYNGFPSKQTPPWVSSFYNQWMCIASSGYVTSLYVPFLRECLDYDTQKKISSHKTMFYEKLEFIISSGNIFCISGWQCNNQVFTFETWLLFGW